VDRFSDVGSCESRDSFDNSARRLMLARFDPVNGMPIWAQLSHDDATAQTDFIARDLVADGDELVAAYIVDEDINDNPGDTQPNIIHLQKTDLDGNILWIKRYDLGTSILRVISVADGYVLSGQRSLNSKYFVFKVNKDGDFVWGKNLTYGPVATVNTIALGPDQSVAVADSLYFTGLATTGLGDVLFWKMLSDGTMVDSCGFVDSLALQVTEIQNPVRTPIILQELITSALATNTIENWTTNTLEEKLVCPDCTVPDPCPEDNDFVVDITEISCSGGIVNLDFRICDLDGGLIPEITISFYDANPYTDGADKLGIYDYSSNGDSCATLQLTDLENQFGPDALVNGFQIFAVVNDLGNTSTPFLPDDFPLSDVEECNYFNNLDSITVQLPTAPTLNLGADQIICSNENAVLNAGPGFFRYQWSNGATTQSTTVTFGGQYRVTVTDPCGFQQSDTINLQVLPLPLVQETGVFCPGKSVTIRGYTFDQAGTFQQTIPGVNGDCDTSVTFVIDVLPYEERIESVFFCPFETVTINGVVYEDSGLALDTIPSTTGCDTVVFYFLNQLPLPFRFYNLEFCPGDSVKFNGNVYYQPIGFTDTLYSTGIGCDTVAYVSIFYASLVEVAETIQFCPGTSVEINGQLYSSPGVVVDTILSTTGGCDTLGTYTLEWLPAPTLAETILFCPGTSVDIGGQSYTQPGTVMLTIPGAAGDCDTLVTYTLQFAPLPTRTETLEFCEGESITLGGQTYTQPTAVTLTVAGVGNTCDTLVTYTLQYLTPPPSSLTVTCPNNVSVVTTPGTAPIPVTYSLPVATSDCVCPGNAVTLASGPSSGSPFPVGNTQVCYTAQDSCGSIANCCFIVTVQEELPCDTKTNGCIKYELLSITADAKFRRTYTIRVTNNCANKLIYTAIQLPSGVTAVNPANLSTYTSPAGREYMVRNPNFAPFYSIRFKSTTDSIANGQSDVFQYTLPAQSVPTFINITTRLETQSFYAAHLNTFNCPIGNTPSSNRSEETIFMDNIQSGILLFPNPTNGELFADLSRWQGEDLHFQILDSRGVRAQSFSMNASSEAQAIPLANQLPAGLYFLEIVTGNGEREVARFVLER
jgi:hypothetical protein